MKAIIEPGNTHGTITAPPSKSMTQRAYAAALLHSGTTTIHNTGNSDDEAAALRLIQQLGAHFSLSDEGNRMVITSNGLIRASGDINCGESGLCARLFAPIAALSSDWVTITGTGTLLTRKMEGFAEVFATLGVAMNGFNGVLPLHMRGPMQARSFKLDASGGSQLLSGLLLAISSCAREAVCISVTGLKSRPYIDLTLEMLAHFGKPVAHRNYREFVVDPSLFTHQDHRAVTIEGDWSSAAYALVAAAIGGEITIQNLNTESLQADRAILGVLAAAGASVSSTADSVSVKRSLMHAFDFYATHCPDLFPALAILAACCEGESSIRGVHRLFNKESNRVESITQMLLDFAVPFSVEDDTLFVTGVHSLQGTVIDTYHDHRIVMAAAIGALRANGPVEIPGAEAVNKSYPAFFEDLILCGVRCNFID